MTCENIPITTNTLNDIEDMINNLIQQNEAALKQAGARRDTIEIIKLAGAGMGLADAAKVVIQYHKSLLKAELNRA